VNEGIVQSHRIAHALWMAADSLRGVLDVRAMQDCLFAMFLLKYVFCMRESQSASGKKRFVIPEAARFDRLVRLCHEPGNARRLDAALQAVADGNPAIGDLFRDFSLDRYSAHGKPLLDSALGRALQSIDDEELHPDHAGAAFEHSIASFSESSSATAGEFYTPRHIVELMTQLVEPKKDDSIYDPLCGSGGMLLRCARAVREHHGKGSYSIYGQDKNHAAWRLAKINAVLHDEDEARIELGDTLLNPRLLQPDGGLRRFDVVIANPPFSVPEWGAELAERDPFNRFKFGTPPWNRADYAFIQHMLASMREGTGRCAVTAPLGALFRAGTEADIRRRLLDANLLDAVIELPPKLFYFTGIRIAILVFRAGRKGREVLFIDASQEFRAGRQRNTLHDEAIERIVATYRNKKCEAK
jgi:type I restriction enzyme M protein